MTEELELPDLDTLPAFDSAAEDNKDVSKIEKPNIKDTTPMRDDALPQANTDEKSGETDNSAEATDGQQTDKSSEVVTDVDPTEKNGSSEESVVKDDSTLIDEGQAEHDAMKDDGQARSSGSVTEPDEGAKLSQSVDANDVSSFMLRLRQKIAEKTREVITIAEPPKGEVYDDELEVLKQHINMQDTLILSLKKQLEGVQKDRPKAARQKMLYESNSLILKDLIKKMEDLETKNVSLEQEVRKLNAELRAMIGERDMLAKKSRIISQNTAKLLKDRGEVQKLADKLTEELAEAKKNLVVKDEFIRKLSENRSKENTEALESKIKERETNIRVLKQTVRRLFERLRMSEMERKRLIAKMVIKHRYNVIRSEANDADAQDKTDGMSRVVRAVQRQLDVEDRDKVQTGLDDDTLSYAKQDTSEEVPRPIEYEQKMDLAQENKVTDLQGVPIPPPELVSGLRNNF